LIPDGDKIHIEHKSATPISMQINRDIQSDSFRIHGITELKYRTSSTGVFLDPKLDMLVIDSQDVEDISPQYLEDLARESGILEDIKCIAISMWLYHFDNFLKSFKKYTSLELLLIVISRPPSIHSAITEENTSSRNGEVIFELFDTNASVSECDWLQIPRMHKESGRFERKHSNFLRDLYFQLARTGGITPHIRFVRSYV
jgi:hypothetical protein